MSRSRLVAVLVAFFVAVPVLAQAQVRYFVRAGLLSPSANFADYAKGGWLGAGGISVPLGQSRWMLEPTLFYGHAAHEGSAGDASNVMGGAMGFTYALASGAVVPYLSTMSGILHHRFDGGNTGPDPQPDTQVLLGAGGGLGLGLGSTMLLLDVRYTHAENTRFMAFAVGLRIGYGGIR